MRKTTARLAAVFAALLALSVMGCKDEPESVKVENITLDKTTLTLAPGKTGKLTATVTPSNADDRTVTWSSSNDDVVMVDSNGTVFAIKAGTAIVTAQAGGKTAMCIVTVTSPAVTVDRVMLDKTTLTLAPGKTGKLTATVTPSDASGKTVAWSSSNSDVATVDNDGMVTAHTEGTTTITAKASGKTAECTVTVKRILIAVDSVTLNTPTLTLTRGETGKLAATVTPDNADDKTVAWSSSNSDVATVDNDGMVTAHTEGTTTITAKASGKTAECTVTVKRILIAVDSVTLNTPTLTLTRGETGKLAATVTPSNADDKTVAWSSSDEAVATVDDDGTVTAVKAGTATITATAQTGGKTAECTVTVGVIVERVTLNTDTLSLAPGEAGKLMATVMPDDATHKAVFWHTSDESVATVDDDGIVTAVKPGTATVTVTTWEGYKTAECTVTVNPIRVAVDSVTLNTPTLTLTRGETRKLTATVTPDNADDKTVAWSSSDEAVATVGSDGTVTAHKAGSATITATAQTGGKTAECTVTVNPILIENVTLASPTLTRGETRKLTVTVTPDNADDKTVAWSSSDPAVATVDKDGTVTAVTAGEATITAQAGNRTAECTVTVNPILVEKVTLNKTALALTRGETERLTVTVTPANADDTAVAWSSSDTSVATVDKDGTVTAVKVGTAIITAQAGDKQATCMVTVKLQTIAVTSISLTWESIYISSGDRVFLSATVKPSNADDKTVKWSSSDTSVATVDKDGTVMAVKVGTATITARAGGKTADCMVSVHVHSYSGGKCTVCGSVPYMKDGTIDDRGVLTKYSGSESTVVIPDGVTGIGDSAFSGCTSLKEVTIPDSVTSIGDSAFSGCTELKSVTIPSGVTGIGDSAFSGCTELKSVTIPSGVTSIGDRVFFGCTNLLDVVIPDSVTSIGRGAFSECTELWLLTIGNSVTSIGDSAFSGCTKLKSVTIPDSVTSIGKYAFSECTELTSVTISGSVTEIGDRAFSSCRWLMTVTISDGVTSIGDYAFSWCRNLTSVTIPDSVTSIGKHAFDECTSLTSVTIPDSVTSIGDWAFNGCTRLTNVKIPASVTSIGESAFNGCTYLTTINYTGTKEQWNAITKGSYWDSYVDSYTITYNYNE